MLLNGFSLFKYPKHLNPLEILCSVAMYPYEKCLDKNVKHRWSQSSDLVSVFLCSTFLNASRTVGRWIER